MMRNLAGRDAYATYLVPILQRGKAYTGFQLPIGVEDMISLELIIFI